MILTVLDAADADAMEAEKWYANENEHLAERFRIELLAHFELIASFPGMFTAIRKNYRRATLAVFPYSIIYLQEKSTIYIVAVAHHSRKPLYWLSRQLT